MNSKARLMALLALVFWAGCRETTPDAGSPRNANSARGDDATGGSKATGGTSGAGGSGSPVVGSGGSKGSGGAGGQKDGGAAGDVAAADAADAGNAPIQLKVAWWGSADRHERTMKVLALFEKKHPQIRFTAEFDAANAYWAKMRAHATAGTLPDIMQMDHAYIGEFTDKGHLLPLDDLAKAGGPLNLTDVPAGILDGGKVKGKLVGVSLGSNTQAFVLDVDAFAKASVALPSDVWSWDDFERMATEIHSKTPALWGYGTGLHSYTPWKAIFLSSGTWVFTVDNRMIGWANDKPWVDHWKRQIKMIAGGVIPSYDQEKAEFAMADDVTKTPIVIGRSAMEQIHSNQLLALANAAGPTRNFKLVPPPRNPGGGASAYVKPSHYFSITSKSKYAKEAALLLDFFTNDLEANEILAAERGVPVATKVLTALKTKLPKAQLEAFDLVDRVLKDGRPLPPPDPAEWGDILRLSYVPNTIAILKKEISPEDGVARFKREATAILNGMPISDGGAPDGGVADAGNGGTDGGSDKRAVLVVAALPLTGNDLAIQTRLLKKLTIEVVTEDKATTDTATGKQLIIVSASASKPGVNTKFADVKTPVILMEPNLMPDMYFTAVPETDHATVAAQTKLTMVAAAKDHPLSAGLTGDVTVYTTPYRAVFGVPGPGAVKIATIVGAPTQAAIFAYPADAMMVGKKAPGKRVGFFIHNSATANVADDGLKLLDAAVDWAVAP